MKLLFPTILYLFILSSGLVSAQSYKYVPFPDSARWTYYAHVEYGQSYLFTITAFGDTLIDGANYTKLYLGDTNDIGVYIGGLAEQNKKVSFRSAYGQNSPVPYVCLPDSAVYRDEVIYDFSVDSFALENWCQHGHFQYAADSSGLVLINGDYRKMYRITFGFPFGDIIEGIGDPECLFSKFYSLPALSASDFTILICFEDFNRGFKYQTTNFFWVYSSQFGSKKLYVNNCNKIALSTNPPASPQRTRLYPNPSEESNQFMIIPYGEVKTIFVYTLEGKEQESISNPTSNVLPTDGWSPGLYLVKLAYENGDIEVLKYVK